MRMAPELGRRPDVEAATAVLVSLAQGDRGAVVAARDAFARRLHGNSTDWDATAALRVLNRAVAAMGWVEPYNWQGRRKP